MSPTVTRAKVGANGGGKRVRKMKPFNVRLKCEKCGSAPMFGGSKKLEGGTLRRGVHAG